MAATSFPTIIQDLPDALLGNAKHLSQCRYRLTFFVSCTDFSITCVLLRRDFRDRIGRQNNSEVQLNHHAARGIAQLLEYGRVVESPMGHYGADHSPA
jgi:Na+/H+ antiporter NhaD/arsenite permease-like protein